MQQAGSVKPGVFDLAELRRRMDEYAELSPEERDRRRLEAERELQALRASERMARRFDALDVSGIPAALRGRTLAELEQHQENYDALVGARAWAAAANANVTQGRGMVLIGPPGVGKTHIVSALAEAAVKDCSRPISVKYLNWSHYCLQGNRDWRKRELPTGVTECDVLILDELGGTAPKDTWAADADATLLELLDARLYGGARKRLVFATTNKLFEEMPATIGARQWSRLKALAPEIYGVAGKDYRGE